MNKKVISVVYKDNIHGVLTKRLISMYYDEDEYDIIFEPVSYLKRAKVKRILDKQMSSYGKRIDTIYLVSETDKNTVYDGGIKMFTRCELNNILDPDTKIITKVRDFGDGDYINLATDLCRSFRGCEETLEKMNRIRVLIFKISSLGFKSGRIPYDKDEVILKRSIELFIYTIRNRDVEYLVDQIFKYDLDITNRDFVASLIKENIRYTNTVHGYVREIVNSYNLDNTIYLGKLRIRFIALGYESSCFGDVVKSLRKQSNIPTIFINIEAEELKYTARRSHSAGVSMPLLFRRLFNNLAEVGGNEDHVGGHFHKTIELIELLNKHLDDEDVMKYIVRLVRDTNMLNR